MIASDTGGKNNSTYHLEELEMGIAELPHGHDQCGEEQATGSQHNQFPFTADTTWLYPSRH